MSDYQRNKVIPGTVYQVIQLLGQGGMGTVYEVEDTTVGKRYVLKTLHAQLRDRKELAVRLHKEARTLARLSHPNIVEVVTAGMTADSLKLPYFVMQKLNGHTLRSVLSAKGCLPLETAYSIAIDLLDALDHAHAIGVIHRDVKPENIFLHRGPSEAHQTKLLDFGVMRMLSSDQPQTGARFVGTLRYAPPEQLRGGQVTPRTDLYSAGLVLFEMIAGGGPFDEETTDRGIANAHLDRKPPLLSSRALVPPALDALVASALAKNPDARPRDAFTFASQLRALSREAVALRGSSSSHGTVETFLVGLGAAPSVVGPDDPTQIASLHSQAQGATLENAGPPTSVPQTTLRMEVPRAAVDRVPAIDRSASTRTSAPLEVARVESTRADVTTMGATESLASDPPPSRRGAMVAFGFAAVALAVLFVTAGTLWAKRRTHDSAAHPSAMIAATVSAPAPAGSVVPPGPAMSASAANAAAPVAAVPLASSRRPRAPPRSRDCPPATSEASPASARSPGSDRRESPQAA
jgi:serine/threonine protein kinase